MKTNSMELGLQTDSPPLHSLNALIQMLL